MIENFLNSRSGFVKKYRSTLANPICCKDVDHYAIWDYLLLSATYKEYAVIFNGHKIILQPGQLITSRKSIATTFKIDESKVERVLKTFVSERQIEQQTSNKNRLVSITNWSLYQFSEQENEQQVNINFTSSEHKQEFKEGKNDNKEKANYDSAAFLLSSDHSVDRHLSESFDNAWSLYGKYGNRKKALEYWAKLNEADRKTILSRIPIYLQHLSRTGQNQKCFDGWINPRHRYWETTYENSYIKSGVDINRLWIDKQPVFSKYGIFSCPDKCAVSGDSLLVDNIKIPMQEFSNV